MTELERPRSYKDERDGDDRSRDKRRGAGCDRHRRGGAGDCVLAIVCWRRKNPAWKGALALLFFALAGKFWPMGEAYEEKAYRKAGVICGSIGAALLAACGRAMKRREEK